MSYDVCLKDPVTKKILELDSPHHMRGGTYAVGGTKMAELNVTYNYAPVLYRVLPEGIRGLYGKSGAETIPLLKTAIEGLQDDVSEDYWDCTEGNVKRSLTQLLSLAQMRPDGVWDGD